MRYKVYITPHALRRWRERVNPNPDVAEIATLVSRKLRGKMRKGLARSGDSFPLEISPGLIAQLDFNRRGPGWAVRTFVVTDRYKLPG